MADTSFGSLPLEVLVPIVAQIGHTSLAALSLSCKEVHQAIFRDRRFLFRSLFFNTFDTAALKINDKHYTYDYETAYKNRIRVLRRNRLGPDVDTVQTISGLRSIREMIEQNDERNIDLIINTAIPAALSASGGAAVRYQASYLRLLLAPTILPAPVTLGGAALAAAHLVVYDSSTHPIFRASSPSKEEEIIPEWDTLLIILRFIVHLILQRSPPPLQVTYADLQCTSLDGLNFEGVISFLHWEHLARLREQDQEILDYNLRGGLDDIVIAPQMITFRQTTDGVLTGFGQHSGRQRGPFTLSGRAQRINYGPGYLKVEFTKSYDDDSAWSYEGVYIPRTGIIGRWFDGGSAVRSAAVEGPMLFWEADRRYTKR